jgi:hypothetical protein
LDAHSAPIFSLPIYKQNKLRRYNLA